MYASASPRVRVVSALASGAVVAAVVYALVTGLGASALTKGRDALVSVVFDAPEPPPPPPPPRKPPKPATKSAPKGDPAPANLRNRAAQVVAPPPRLVLTPPPPVAVATQTPGLGSAAQTGASDRLGPGQGAGGVGDGFGGGGYGGDGDGRPAKGPRQIRGKLGYSDLPDELLDEGEEAAVGVRYTVEPDGRVSRCLVDEPSRYRALNALTCRLIEERFVFRPARNRAGEPVRAQIAERHTWVRRTED